MEVRMNLWYWLRSDLKEDLSRAEWVRFQRFSARRTVDLKARRVGVNQKLNEFYLNYGILIERV